MLRCRVADIGDPPIDRITRGEPAHDAVAGDLGDDGSSGDREAESVSVDDGLHRAIARRRDGAVAPRESGADAAGPDRAAPPPPGAREERDTGGFPRTRPHRPPTSCPA